MRTFTDSKSVSAAMLTLLPAVLSLGGESLLECFADLYDISMKYSKLPCQAYMMLSDKRG